VQTFVKKYEESETKLGGLSHFGFAWGRQVRGSIIVRGGGGSLDYEMCDTSWIGSVVAGSPVMF
jgi:hypothetical protein